MVNWKKGRGRKRSSLFPFHYQVPKKKEGGGGYTPETLEGGKKEELVTLLFI